MPESDLMQDPLLEHVPIHEGYKVLGGVVLYQKLGQGGMGAVYKGKHVRLEVDVAIKLMIPLGAFLIAIQGLAKFIRDLITAITGVREQ